MLLLPDLLYSVGVYMTLLFLLYAAPYFSTARLWDLGLCGVAARFNVTNMMVPMLLLAITTGAGGPKQLNEAGLFIRIGLIVAFIVILDLVQSGLQGKAAARAAGRLKTAPLAEEQVHTLKALISNWGHDYGLRLGWKPPLTEAVAVEYQSPRDLLDWLQLHRAIVIPRPLLDRVSAAEVAALGARQLCSSNSVALMTGLLPCLTALAVGAWARGQDRPDVALAGAVASLAAQVFIAGWALRRLDRDLDRKAVALSKDPEAYISGLEKAQQTQTSPPRHPFWFRRDPLAKRIEFVSRLTPAVKL